MNFRTFQFRAFPAGMITKKCLDTISKSKDNEVEKIKITMVIGSHTVISKCRCPLTVSSVCVFVWRCNQVTCNCPDLSHTYSFREQSSRLFSLSMQARISHWRMSHSWHNEQIKTVWANWIVSEEQRRTLQSNELTISSSWCSLPVSEMKLKQLFCRRGIFISCFLAIPGSAVYRLQCITQVCERRIRLQSRKTH